MLITLRTQWFCKVANFLMSLFCSEFPSDFRGGVGFCLSADRHSFSLPQILSETLERRQLRTNFKSSASFFSSGRKTSRRENFLQKLCQRNFGNGKMNGSSNGYFFPVSLFWRQFGTEKKSSLVFPFPFVSSVTTVDWGARQECDLLFFRDFLVPSRVGTKQALVDGV